MSNWTATNELRFVKRILKWESGEGNTRIPLKTMNILQQKWEKMARRDPTKDYEIVSEWRDVPIVEEK